MSNNLYICRNEQEKFVLILLGVDTLIYSNNESLKHALDNNVCHVLKQVDNWHKTITKYALSLGRIIQVVSKPREFV